MPQLLQIPGTTTFVQFLLTKDDAPRTEPGWSHEFESPYRWGFGTVYRVYRRLAVMVGKVEPEPLPKDFMGSEAYNLRLIGEDEIDVVRANLDDDGLRRIRKGYRPWYADRRDTAMFHLQTWRLRGQGYIDRARRSAARRLWPDAQAQERSYNPYKNWEE